MHSFIVSCLHIIIIMIDYRYEKTMQEMSLQMDFKKEEPSPVSIL